MRMKLFGVVAAWLATLAAFGGFAVLGAPAAHADTIAEENQFLDLTNQLRSSLGIQTLTPQPQLTTMARNWSAQMAAAGTISHNPNLTSQAPSNWTALGENVGMGGAVAAIQTAFINSPHHYENLANGAYNFVGIGVVDSNGTIFVTVD
ncbi:MAG: CAP domain-containing protein, partial [Acidimicrobiia bacterium]|nr:CAP domain-containing protein [Acidimicrobiia bacterium]